MSLSKIEISAFFPAYNEAGNIENLTRRTANTLKQLAAKWEIIIIDDGSKDNTAKISQRLVKEIPGVRYICHEKNRGYGGAVKTGLKNASYEWIFFTDGDNQFDTREIELLLPHTKNADFVLGYRLNRKDNFMRQLNAWAWGTLVRTLFGLHGISRDIDCAFKLFKRKVVDEYELYSEGAMISTELLVKAKKLGYKFKEQGVHHLPRTVGTQTGANLKVILRAFKELFKLYKYLK